MKKCYKCRENKDLCEFTKDSSRPGGLSNMCRKCRFSANRVFRNKNTQKIQKEISRVRNGFITYRNDKRIDGCNRCYNKNKVCLVLCARDKQLVKSIENAYNVGDSEVLAANLPKLVLYCYNCCVMEGLRFVYID